LVCPNKGNEDHASIIQALELTPMQEDRLAEHDIMSLFGKISVILGRISQRKGVTRWKREAADGVRAVLDNTRDAWSRHNGETR